MIFEITRRSTKPQISTATTSSSLNFTNSPTSAFENSETVQSQPRSVLTHREENKSLSLTIEDPTTELAKHS